MAGQTDIGMDGRWTGGMMDGQMDGYEGRWVDRQMWSWMLDGRMDGWMWVWMGGQTVIEMDNNGQVDGWMDRWMHGCGCGWVDKQM